jgi:hypothetical protein
MGSITGRKYSRLTPLLVLAAVSILLVSCGGGVPEEEFESLQADLQAAQAQVQTLAAEKLDLQTKVLERTLEDIAKVVSVNELMAFPPTVVELKPDSAAVKMVTKVPTTCSIAHGLTTAYGEISVDRSMYRGGHTEHYHILRGLQPDTVYHYKWGLLGPNGTLYGSRDLTFKTPPAASSIRRAPSRTHGSSVVSREQPADRAGFGYGSVDKDAL